MAEYTKGPWHTSFRMEEIKHQRRVIAELLEACEELMRCISQEYWYCPACSEPYLVYEGHADDCEFGRAEAAIRAAIAKAKGDGDGRVYGRSVDR